MGFQVISQRYKKRASAGPPSLESLYPAYGISTKVLGDSDLIFELAAQHRGPNLSRIATFSLTSTVGEYMWYVYPTSYGLATFTDTDSGFQGGWDGAHNDPFTVWGPSTVDVLVNGVSTPFYCYRTDWDSLGLCNWSVT